MTVTSHFKRPSYSWRDTSTLLFGLASNGVYICPCCYQQGGSLLHCPSTLTRIIFWRYISVALSLESPPPDVIRHPALRSPDFPRLNPFVCSAAITWPGCASAILARFFALVKKFHSLLFTPFSVTLPKFISNCLRQWNFGLYVSG